ncbi:large conductance mechanosensitive channel protein MscL [Marivirga lumbricoides]|uniref:Large-conductance mechanosensitive channel n=1 Tax=Marivirga lumbricoides TaxID=1046115 RepID=A0A2T4DTL3_9BACT|nr:large conductance mechanosensitive channel protein MscL [Marivirga lumbricoides]
MKIIKEFKEFAIKGNVFDMAVGIIIGTAFTKVVSSFVKDILMPLLSLAIGEVNFTNLSLVLKDEVKDDSGTVVQELVALNYGAFIQFILDFLIIAFCIFMVVRIFNRLKRKSDVVEVVEVPTPKDIELLSEIRDLLKDRKG